MRQKILTSRASFERRGWESREEEFLGQTEQARPWTEPMAPIEPCHPEPDDERWRVWLGAILCVFFLHRWFNQYDAAAKDGLHRSSARHWFAQGGLRLGAQWEMASGRSRHLIEEHGFLGQDSSPVLSEGQTEPDPSWRSPWLYLSFLLLVWLLLL
jgi:hypothetical protein